ncbi:hypothetical protein ACOMHN_044006 [Nucella lapillus]
MGERKGVNKYYPPDFDPSKGSLNTWLGSHPLRDRARKLHMGILVIRFEMPYNIWCGGCSNPIGMGVRYNAEKSKVGNYYTTPIYKFRMKCHLCDNYFEIQTDPKNHDYVILSGARRMEQRWDPRENEQIVPEDKATQKKLATDPMYKLEHVYEDKQRGQATQMTVSQVEEKREAWLDDYRLNQMARKKFRVEKKQIAASKAKDKALLDKSSLDIDLVPENETDQKIASLMKYSVTSSFDENQQKKRKEIEDAPIFSVSGFSSKPGMKSSFNNGALHKVRNKLGVSFLSPKVGHSRNGHALKGIVKKVRRPATSRTATSRTATCASQREGPASQDVLPVSTVTSQASKSEQLSTELADSAGAEAIDTSDGSSPVSGQAESVIAESSSVDQSADVSPNRDNCNTSHSGLAALSASYADSDSSNSDPEHV